MRKAGCHQRRKHFSKGLCVRCYRKLQWQTNRAYYQQNNRAWLSNNKERRYWSSKAAELKRVYGITLEDYNKLSAKQNNVCAICKGVNAKKALYVDHDHKTGRIRGLLCLDCNLCLGRIDKHPGVLQAITDYYGN